MVLRMKNFNIFGVHWKIQLLGGVHEKPISRGDCLKREGLEQLVDLREGLGKKEGGGVFEGGGLIPQCTLCTKKVVILRIFKSLSRQNECLSEVFWFKLSKLELAVEMTMSFDMVSMFKLF